MTLSIIVNRRIRKERAALIDIIDELEIGNFTAALIYIGQRFEKLLENIHSSTISEIILLNFLIERHRMIEDAADEIIAYFESRFTELNRAESKFKYEML